MLAFWASGGELFPRFDRADYSGLKLSYIFHSLSPVAR